MSITNEGCSFTEDDIWRLERSVAWQQHPALVERLCRLLHDVDPMNLWTGENPHALTEYLIEAAALVDGMPKIQSEQDVASALAAVFNQMFDGYPASCAWEELAEAAWPIVAEYQGAAG